MKILRRASAGIRPTRQKRTFHGISCYIFCASLPLRYYFIDTNATSVAKQEKKNRNYNLFVFSTDMGLLQTVRAVLNRSPLKSERRSLANRLQLNVLISESTGGREKLHSRRNSFALLFPIIAINWPRRAEHQFRARRLKSSRPFRMMQQRR